jgi:hypothetical protein
LESNINLSINDNATGVDGDTVELTVGGLLAWQSDTEQSGFSVTKTAVSNGFQYNINPDVDFPSYSEIRIDAYAADNNENVMDSYYVFQTMDLEAPFVKNQLPGDLATEVSQNIFIQFDVYGRNTGVDQYSIDAYVNNRLAMEDGYFVAPFDEVGSASYSTSVDGYDGYHIIIDRDVSYTSEGTVLIDIYAVNQDGY